jgi:pyrroline-5-carboxylate reductase
MNVHPKIAIIGSGVMGEAIIAGLIRNEVTLPANIQVSDTRRERADELHSSYGVSPFTDNPAAVSEADVVVLSVKPQRLDLVMSGLKDKIPQEALVLSIIAGATIDKITTGLNHNYVVRSMPNTPAQIGEGITVWVASPLVSPDQLELTRRILTALGQEVYAEEENFLDMATALSGTGPAYVFLFMEALIDAGVHLGFSRRIAEQLVTQTLRGSVDYYQKRMAHPAHLRNEVTSPGGTSAEALYYLEKAGFRTAISRAVWAAYERSKELGQGKEAQVPDKKTE